MAALRVRQQYQSSINLASFQTFCSSSIIDRMPPRIPRVSLGLSKLSKTPIESTPSQICPACTFARRTARRLASTSPQRSEHGRKRPIEALHNPKSTLPAHTLSLTKSSTAQVPLSQRIELRDSLLDLQKHAANYVKISRLQLAVRGLDQPAGDEKIRIAIMGLYGEGGDGDPMRKVKQLVRVFLADPLVAEEGWERILSENGNVDEPLLIRISSEGGEPVLNNPMLRELHVSSPTLNRDNIEILVMPINLRGGEQENEILTEMLLVPTIEVPTSGSGRATPVTIPVHKTLVVADGLDGVEALFSSGLDSGKDFISVVVDMGSWKEEARNRLLPVNINYANDLLSQFRGGSAEAFTNGAWQETQVPYLSDHWLKRNTTATGDGSMKVIIYNMIEELLESANAAIKAEQARQSNLAIISRPSPAQLDSLKSNLTKWAETAHTELRDHLDIAFNGKKWRKLGWWKLFWRVDDVSMIASSILARRFLVDAEKEVIFLAGRIEEAGVFKNTPDPAIKHWAYKPLKEEELVESKIGDEPKVPKIKDLVTPEDGERGLKNQNWPLHIPSTRKYLDGETVPALQALAQKLVLQTLTTTSLFSALGGLTYVSSVSTSLYEASAVTALGVVWALRRMQGKWEAARTFWEGEVREEGRKAVRGVEGVVGGVLRASGEPVMMEDPELVRAKGLVRRAEEALGPFDGGGV